MSEIEIPKGWIHLENLSEVISILESGKRPVGGVKGILQGIPSLGGEHLNYNGKFNFKTMRFVPQDYFEKIKRGLIQEKDILMVKDGATTGKTSFVDETFPYKQACVNEHVFIIRPNERMLPKLLYYFLRSGFGQRKIFEKTKGTIGGVNTTFVNNFPISFPEDKEIQKNLVRKLDHVLEQLEEKKKDIVISNEQLIKKLQSQSNVTKKVILKDSFSGKLSFHKMFNSSDFLIEQLKTLKATQIKDGSYSMIKYNKLSSEQISLPYAIPKKWIWIQMGDVIESMKNGIYKPSNFYGDGIPCLRMYNIENGKIVMKNVKEMILTSDEIRDFGLIENDILFNRVNSRELVAKSAVIPKGLGDIIFESKNIRIRLWSNLINSHYVNYYLQTSFMRQLIESTCKKTAGMATVPQTNIAEWLIPICSREEQDFIVNVIEQKIDVIKKIDDHVELLQKKSNKLKRYLDDLTTSILNKAFLGKLVN